MRNFIDLVENAQRSDEAYSENNSALRNYLKHAGDFDHYGLWFEVCMWLDQHDEYDAVNDALDKIEPDQTHEINTLDDLNEQSPELFEHLPPDIQKAAGAWATDYIMRHDPANAPTGAHMSLKSDKLLHRTTWLIHFTNDPNGIAATGFTRGMDEMDRLGLTTYLSDKSKASGGYNFAFLADGRHANWAASEGKYGRNAVMFQNSGVHAYHYGDEEDQIIFWGKDVDPRSIIVLAKEDGDWVVESRRRTRRGDYELFRGEFEAAVNWVQRHYTQYRKLLTGF